MPACLPMPKAYSTRCSPPIPRAITTIWRQTHTKESSRPAAKPQSTDDQGVFMKQEVKAGQDLPRRLHGDYWRCLETGAVELTGYSCTHCGACYLPSIATCSKCRGKDFKQ